MFKLWFEDLVIGAEETIGEVTTSKEDIVRFAREFDPQPFHLDDAFARQTPFGGLCASGWHTASLIMRVMVDKMMGDGLAGLGSPGLDRLDWRKPLFPDDVLAVSSKMLEKRPSKSRPDLGLVKMSVTAVNQKGETVLYMVSNMMVACRPAG